MPRSWDPEEVLDIFPRSNPFSCVGTTKQGLRCGNSLIKRDYIRQAQQILNNELPELNQCRARPDSVLEKLERVAWLILCPRWHQSKIPQAEIVAGKWLQTILDLERSASSRSSHSTTSSSHHTSRNESSSGGSSSGGGGNSSRNAPRSVRSSTTQETSSEILSNGSRAARSTTLGSSGSSSSATLSNGSRTVRTTTLVASSPSRSSAGSQTRQHWANLQPTPRSTQPATSTEAYRVPRPPPIPSSTSLERTITSLEISPTPSSPPDSLPTVLPRSRQQNRLDTHPPSPRPETRLLTAAQPRDSTQAAPANVPYTPQRRTPTTVSLGPITPVSRGSTNNIQINLNITISGHQDHQGSDRGSPQTPTPLTRHIRGSRTPFSTTHSNQESPFLVDSPQREARSVSGRRIDTHETNPSIAEVIEALESFVSRLSTRSMLPSPAPTSRGSRDSRSTRSRSLSHGSPIDSPTIVEFTPSSSGFSTPGQNTPPESPFQSPFGNYPPSSSGSSGLVIASEPNGASEIRRIWT